MSHEKLAEVPHDILGSICEGKLFLQVREDFPCIFPIDIRLLEKCELIPGTKFLHKLQDFIRRPWLLSTKLIAGEGKHLEPTAAILIGQANELCVISLGQASFGGHINDTENIALVLFHGNFRPVDEPILQSEEVGFRNFWLFAIHGSCDEGLRSG